MNIAILGLGVWARGLTSYTDLLDCMTGVPSGAAEFINPKPEAIPARERRRAGLMINLAVEVAHQACEHADIDKSSVPSVFVSAMGDTDITDYMCRKLAQPEKLLSPTKFHNSVHNAPAGYWSISAENRCPSTFVGGADHSFGAGLLEAVSQAHAHAGPVLMVAYDIANRQPFQDVFAVQESLACALIVAPQLPAERRHGLSVHGSLELVPAVAETTNIPEQRHLAELSSTNPMGGGLRMLEHLALIDTGRSASADMIIPAAEQLSLQLELHRS